MDWKYAGLPSHMNPVYVPSIVIPPSVGKSVDQKNTTHYQHTADEMHIWCKFIAAWAFPLLPGCSAVSIIRPSQALSEKTIASCRT